jgi:membrane fusion protein (multidrug efflux system)
MSALAALLAVVGCGVEPPEPRESAPVAVQVERVERAPFRATVELLGRVGPHARIPIQVREGGRVRYSSRFQGGLRTGARVERGEVLLALESPELELGVATAELEERAAFAEVERARRGVEAGFVPSIDLERAQLQRELAAERLAHARERRQRLEVAAPASGYLAIDERVAEGTEVAAGAVLATVGESGAARLEGLAAAGDLPRLAPGQAVECRLPGESDPVALARLLEVAREIEPGGSARVVAEVTEDYGLPAPGEGLELRVLLDERPAALSVPELAVVRSGGIASVFVLEPSGEHLRASRQVVQLGGRAAGRVEVLDGLSGGETVAVLGVDLLSDGAMARVASAAR